MSAGIGTILPIYVEQASGGIVVDVDGNQLIDFGSGIAVVSVGNAAPRVVGGRPASRSRTSPTPASWSRHTRSTCEVAEALNELTPGRHEKRSALFNSGAEAVENAVKIARHYTGRPAVVAFDHAYHGRTNLTMALTAKNMPYKHRFGPFAGEVYRAPMAYPFRWPGGCGSGVPPRRSGSSPTTRTPRSASRTSPRSLSSRSRARAGSSCRRPGSWPQLAAWCAEHGIVLIADEIQTGFCRTGDWFACSHEDVVPDLITTAKGIAGGLPLAGVTGRAEIMDAVHSGGLGGTYGGNPVACAAALAAIETMRADDLCAAARRIESVMRPRLEALAAKYDVIGDVRGRGAMLAMELVTGGGSLEPNPQLTSAVSAACHREGLITLTAGTYGNVLRFLPPLVIGDALLTEGLDLLESAFAAAVHGHPSAPPELPSCRTGSRSPIPPTPTSRHRHLGLPSLILIGQPDLGHNATE